MKEFSEIDFEKLVESATSFLDSEAKSKSDYYRNIKAEDIEIEVLDALRREAKRLHYSIDINQTGSKVFPDIICNKIFGVEVKSTLEDTWKVSGNSVLENTRPKDVERVFVVFCRRGKKEIGFKCRAYEDVLSGISVTHSPRYQIDMNLKEGETVCEKMNIDYDDLRVKKDSIYLIAKYLKENLKPGQQLWWDLSSYDGCFEDVPAIIDPWGTLSEENKNSLKIEGIVRFSDSILNSDYGKFSEWLLLTKGVSLSNTRDAFSAGGRVVSPLPDEEGVRISRIFHFFEENSDSIYQTYQEIRSEDTGRSFGDWLNDCASVLEINNKIETNGNACKYLWHYFEKYLDSKFC